METFEEKHARLMAEMYPPEKFLFYWKLYTLIEDDKFSTLSEIEAEKKLLEFPKMKTYYFTTVAAMSLCPEILKNRIGLKKMSALDSDTLSDYIFFETSVRVPAPDLEAVRTVAQLRHERWLKRPLSDRVAEFMASIKPDPGLETERFLFSFKKKFHLIVDGQYRKIDEAEVRTNLTKHSDIKIYYLCTNKSMCPLPPSYVGKDAQGVQLKDDTEVVAYINTTAGCKITIKDL